MYLVGAGPGDPDLLTFKALRLMQRADVVLYDRLIGKGILNLVRRDAERIYVGKLPQEHTVPQPEISACCCGWRRKASACSGSRAAIRSCSAVVARRSSFSPRPASRSRWFRALRPPPAAPRTREFPLTHRDHAQACVFVTGHTKDGRLDLDWNMLLQPHQTVAVYMGLALLAELSCAFIDHGAAPASPVVLIENGTRPNQRVLSGTFDTIAERAAKAGVKGPAILIIGSVVRLREKLDWFVPEAQASDTKCTMAEEPATAMAAE